MLMRVACLLIAATQIVACSNPVEPRPIAEVTVVEQTGGSSGFRLVVEVSNPGARPVYLEGCATSLERSVVPGQWEGVWSVICALIAGGQGLLVPAGESRTFPVVISEQPGTNYTLLPLPPNATYRLRMGVLVENELVRLYYPDGPGRAFQTVTSNEFALKPQ